ncbi:Pol polyprotein [Elysia marginata]|uniref:Pol polyprotein n=1 Tax=Elysia marginata TaxID=1093978 RepID=A0AAV4FHC6_9GAST|nr:Pol polyprotein [Elysia marginata]
MYQAAVDEGPPTSSSAISAASLTVIEDIEGEHFNESDCETLPELGGWGSNETVNDLQYGTISLQDENVEKVRNAPRPKTKKEVRAFLGLVGYYKEFVPNFAAISAPLSDLVRKGQPNTVNWSDSQEKAYNALKFAVTSKPVLQLPDIDKRFILRTDASGRGLGAALMQESDGMLSPVSYASKKLIDREQKYSLRKHNYKLPYRERRVSSGAIGRAVDRYVRGPGFDPQSGLNFICSPVPTQHLMGS